MDRMTEEKNESGAATALCYLCKTETTDFVMERRQVSGGDGVVYSGDFRQVPVCANRRTCADNKERRAAAQRYSKACVICGASCEFTDSTREAVLLEHAKSAHTQEEILAVAMIAVFPGPSTVVNGHHPRAGGR